MSALGISQQTVQKPTMTFPVTTAETKTFSKSITKFVIRLDAPLKPFSVVLTSQGSDGRGEVLEVSDMNWEKVVVQNMDSVSTKVALKY